MFSFYIPTSALNEQKKALELMGENIANLNTPGFKNCRVTFLEALGTVTGKNQMLFKQGALTYTGNVTDLAIKGKSFFILKHGDETYYTRAGAFQVDEIGKLVNVDGYNVQGWMYDVTANSETRVSNSITDIVIDPDLILPARATENVWLSGNLNAGLESTREEWATGTAFRKKAIVEGTTDLSGGITITAGTNDQFRIIFDPQFGETITQDITITAGNYADADALASEINTQIQGTSLDGKVKAEADASGQYIRIKAIDGYSGTQISLNEIGSGTFLNDIGINDSAQAISGDVADESTELNDLLQVTSDLIGGDTFNISGTDKDGNNISGTFTYGSGNDGTTLSDLISVINNLYSGYSTATLSDGKIVLSDDVPGDSSTTISLTADTGNTGVMSVPGFVNTVAGYTANTSASMVVFDSLGQSHNITIVFKKTGTAGEWEWEVKTSTEETIVSGGTGRILFDADGDLVGFLYDGGVDALRLRLANGADDLEIKIHSEEQEGVSSGVTQYNAVSTLHTKYRDGRESGYLSEFKIEGDGSIIGYFTNGEEAKIAQIALAKFTNPAGLKKAGGSNFLPTENSGFPNIGEAESLDSTIESGNLELSTVDLAEEFTKMIEAQRAYQAAARVVSTLEQIADVTTNLKR